MTYRRKWGAAGGGSRPATPAQTGKALGTSGPTADWPFTHLQPGGQCDSTAAEHEHQERGNPPAGSPHGRWRSRERLTAGLGAGEMAQAAKARGNARDTPTWATMAGGKRSQ
jgi:hypothetical protein